MPRGDGTGPIGMGPMTGRGAGFCAGFKIPRFKNPRIRRGMELGWGRGFGRMLCLAGLLPGCGYLVYKWKKRTRIQKQ